MNEFIPIIMEAYAGQKADETPKAFLHQGGRYTIEEVVDRWYQAGRDPTLSSASYFKVRVASGEIFIVKRDNESQNWFLRVGQR